MSDDTTDYSQEFGEAFQRHILAVAARTRNFIRRYGTAMSPEYFTSPVNKILAKVLFAHVNEFNSLPSRSLLYENAKKLADPTLHTSLDGLIEKLFVEDIGDHAGVQAKVVEFGKVQALINAALGIGDLIDSGKRKEIVPHFQKALMVGEDILDIGIDYMATLRDRAASYMLPEEHIDVVPTGLPHLDYLLGGGLARGELGVVLAPPGRGKTTLLINFGIGALFNVAGLTVVHYTLEIDREKVTKRYDDRVMRPYIGMKKTDPGLYGESLIVRAQRAVRGSLTVQQYYTRQATVSTFRSHLTQLSGVGIHPDLVIVDYGDIVKPERRLGEMRHEQAGVYEDLRALAGEFDCAVWTASQGKSSSVDKQLLTIADFAESFEKAAIVDVAVAFCQTAEEMGADICRLFLAKCRSNASHITVWAQVNRDACYVRSYGLMNSADAQIRLKGDPEIDSKGGIVDDGTAPKKGEEKVTVTKHEPGVVDLDKLKKAAGIVPPKKTFTRSTAPSTKVPQKPGKPA